MKFVDRTFSCKKNHALPILRCISEHDNDITNLIYIKIKKAFPPCTLYEKEACYFFHSEIMFHAPTYPFDYFLIFLKFIVFFLTGNKCFFSARLRYLASLSFFLA